MILIFMGMLFLMSMQPIMMVVMIIFITFFYSFFIYSFMMGYWFSYALVMVLLSGVLVVFTYMVSLIPNESFEFYNLIFIVIFMLMYVGGFYFSYFMDMSFVSLNLWSLYISVFNLFLVGFLFSMMIMVVWVSCFNEGAVRVFYKCAWLKG